MTIGELIECYRNNHGLSQRQFANQCGLSNGYISMLEKGVNPNTMKPITPTLPQYQKVAAGMGISLTELFDKIDDMPVDISLPSNSSAHVPSLSDEALKIAAAYDKATAKERMMVQVALSDYIERDFTPVRIAALSKDGQPIDFTGVDPEAAPELDFVDGPPIP